MLLALALLLLPIGLLFYQSFLSAPFFSPRAVASLAGFRFVLADPEFWLALGHSLALATGMAVIALPTGAVFALLLTRTDLPCKAALEMLILLPMMIPSIVLGFGYSIAAGPVGFASAFARTILGAEPWRIESPAALIVIAGLGATPYVTLALSSSLRSIPADMEEAARAAGATGWRIAAGVTLPLATPAIASAAVFVFLIGIELFGLPLVLGSNAGFDVLSVYLFKLTSRLGTPAYHVMAAVVVIMLALTMSLVALQRRLLPNTRRFAVVGGKGNEAGTLRLGRWRWAAVAMVVAWGLAAVLVPLLGIVVRSMATDWHDLLRWPPVLDATGFGAMAQQPVFRRAILNSLAIGVFGALAALACYAVIALAASGRGTRLRRLLATLLDDAMMLPRAVPGLVMGLAMLWMFLFITPLKPLRGTLLSVWAAYMLVYFAYGVRLLSVALAQIAPELAEAARSCGAGAARIAGGVTLPLLRRSLFGLWLLLFLMFEREYAAGVYLLGTGTETVGALLVSLSESGNLDVLAALSVVNVAIIALGLAVAAQAGVRLRD